MKTQVLKSEVDADGGNIRIFELVISESLQDGGLADGGGPHNDELEHKVVFALHVLFQIFISLILSIYYARQICVVFFHRRGICL